MHGTGPFEPLLTFVSSVRDELAPGSPCVSEVRRQLGTLTRIGIPAVLSSAAEIVAQERPRGECVVHENGFRKISLYKVSSSEIQVRLNIWPAGTVDKSIHDHRWHFVSSVLAGAYDHRLHEVCASDAGTVDMIELHDADANLVKRVGETKRVAHRVVSETRVVTGASYSLAASEFHQIDTDGGAITILVSGPPIKTYTNVIRTSSAGSVRRRLSPDESIRCIRECLDFDRR